MRAVTRHAAAALLALGLGTAQAGADQPLWELGAGVSALSFPAYRGADERRLFILPVPYFVYHGRFLKADRHGVRGQLFDSDRLELSLSGALSPPAASDRITARAGMPDLKATFELGPELDATLWRSDSRARSLKLQLPLRAAFTLESSPRQVGWVAQPRLNLDLTDLPGFPGWNMGLQAGPMFGDQHQHAYYYGVTAAQATPTRPAYEAHGGYGGMSTLVSLSKRFPTFWVGAFARYDRLGGARFADSPLLRRRDDLAGGVAVTWIVGESATRVPVDD